VLIGNATRGPDGRWTALDGRAIYAHAKTAGYLYEAALRYALTERLGVAWGPVRNGIADIDGVPRGVIEAFSTRRRQILARMRQMGTRTARAAQVATLTTRPAKPAGVSEGSLRAGWQARAAALGFGRARVEATFRPRPADPAGC
jgi:conjugative relaxase-like TrwC/TraI family protein